MLPGGGFPFCGPTSVCGSGIRPVLTLFSGVQIDPTRGADRLKFILGYIKLLNFFNTFWKMWFLTPKILVFNSSGVGVLRVV